MTDRELIERLASMERERDDALLRADRAEAELREWLVKAECYAAEAGHLADELGELAAARDELRERVAQIEGRLAMIAGDSR